MKKRFLKAFSLLLTAVLFSLVNAPVSSVSGDSLNSIPPEKGNTITVARSNAPDYDIEKVYAARFLNMLNHNYVYGGSFDNIEDIVNYSMPALVDLRDSEDDSYIKEQYVTDYIKNMYGIEIIDYSDINSGFAHVEGYVYIIPRGYTEYKHTVESISVNEDGSFTVKTNVTVTSHDIAPYSDVCETLFVKNEASAFGFSIISSVIGASAVSA